MSDIANRWRDLSGFSNWAGLLDPLDSDLRRYLIHYATMVQPANEGFINEPASKNIGLCRYARNNLLAKGGADKGNPFKYQVTKYFYAPSTIPTPMEGYTVTPTRSDAVLKESNWMGYVAVATDEGKVALGRRDILIVWRGTIRPSEWLENFSFSFVKAPLIFGEVSEALVHKGWHNMYTTKNEDPRFNNTSARDEIREEVARLVQMYSGDEISITVTGVSLGASLATITATDLAVNPIKDDVLVTAFLFASPKVGDVNFQDTFSRQRNLRGLRVSDVNDPITLVPPVGPPDGQLLPLLPYQDAGVGFAIEAKKSDYLKPDLDVVTPERPLAWLTWHDMMLYLHGIDGFQGSREGGFELHGIVDLAKVNRYGDALEDNLVLNVPVSWYNILDKGMVQQEDGKYILDDHEVDDIF